MPPPDLRSPTLVFAPCHRKPRLGSGDPVVEVEDVEVEAGVAVVVDLTVAVAEEDVEEATSIKL